jgi:hypothetical protein
MDIKILKKIMPILQAIVDGKTIQHQTINREWYDTNVASLDHLVTYYKDYRIKPEPKYRPFKDAEECWQEMQKHQPFGWIKCKEGYFNIVYVDDYYVGLSDKDNSSILLASKNSYQDDTFADGTPFGVKVEE